MKTGEKDWTNAIVEDREYNKVEGAHYYTLKVDEVVQTEKFHEKRVSKRPDKK